MDTVIVFLIFIICVVAALLAGIPMWVPLAAGFVLFFILAVRRGFRPADVLAMAWGSIKETFIVIGILLIIGCLTGIWRLCGTIAYFVEAGINVIPKTFFLLAAFLLTSAMSFAIGTSFGVTATAGVILMSIARAGGVNPIIAAGAVMSGVYVGDRGSPASSCANLVATLTETDINRNIRKMLRTGAVPFALCCVAYACLSLAFPIESTDTQILRDMEEEFSLTWICLAPAVLMIILPFCRVPVRLAMTISICASVATAVFVQNATITDCIRAMISGYTAQKDNLDAVLSGGGVVSMIEVCIILLISGSYGGIFHGTGLLSGTDAVLKKLSTRLGRIAVMDLLSIAVCVVFCNQTIGVIMLNQISAGLYGEDEEERYAKMIETEDSVVCLAGLVPWCIACSVPLSMLGTGTETLPFAFFLWLIPLCALLSGRKIPQDD